MPETDPRIPIQAIIDQMGANQTLRVLEAGCGSSTNFRFPRSRSVGIDISQEQLDRNTLLDEKILGDIETFPLESLSFDIIFCWDVLEHLERPEKALVNFARALRENGIIVLGGPVARSVKGAVTKYSPHWFHVLVYRHLQSNKNSGKPGYAPFKTVFKDSMSPPFLVRFARENQLLVEQHTLYEGPSQILLRKRQRLIDVGLCLLSLAIKILSFGRLDSSISDFVIVLRKPVAGRARPE
jgi:SAM-dependent methyltransferase